MKPAEFKPPGRILGSGGVTIGLVKKVFKFLNSLRNIQVKSTGRDVVHYSENGILIEVKGGGDAGGSDGFRFIPASIEIDDIIPTVTEIKDGIEDAYDSISEIPRVGDLIYMTEFHYLVSDRKNISGTNIETNDMFRLIFTVEEVDYIAFQIGPNRLL
jgi:hypothetical protein